MFIKHCFKNIPLWRGYLYASLVLFVGLLLFAILSNWDSAHLFITDDLTFCFSLGQQVAEGAIPLVGLPSHVGARHFAPCYLWLCGLVHLMSAGKIEIFFLIFSLIKIAGLYCFCQLLLLLAKLILSNLEDRLLIICVFLTAIINSHSLWLIRFEWVNNLMPTVTVFSLFIFALIHIRGLRYWPLFLLTSVTLLSFHLGMLPVLAGQIVTLIARATIDPTFRSSIKTNGSLKPKSVWAIFLATPLLIAPLCYELFYFPNIITTIQSQLATSELAKSGIIEATSLFLTTTIRSITPLWSDFFSHYITAAWLILSILALAKLWRAKALPLFWVFLSCLISSLLAIFGAAQQTHLLDYFYNGLIPCFWLQAMTLVIILLSYCQRLLTERRQIFFSLILVLLIAGAASGMLQARKKFLSQPIPAFSSLQHAQNMAKILKADAKQQVERTKILVVGERKLRKDAYQLLINPRAHFKLHYSRRMLEFPQMQKTRQTDQLAYLISCSSNVNKLTDANLFGKKIEKNWEFERELDLTSCDSCQSCRVLRLVPRRSAPPAR